MPSRRGILTGASALLLVVLAGVADYFESCPGSVPETDSIQNGDEVIVGGELRNVAFDGTSIRVVNETTAIVEFPPSEWDEVKTLSEGSCINGIRGTVQGVDSQEGILFIEDGDIELI